MKEFSDDAPAPAPARVPYRMCYCSSHDRGLYMIIKDLWPLIKHLEPHAELHVYYGMGLIPDANFKAQVMELLKSDGVIDHGRTPLEEVVKEKRISSFHLYYTDTLGEIDCITIRESLVTGCIPIISDANVFAERDGLRFKWIDQQDPNFRPHLQHIAERIVDLIHQPEEVREKYRRLLRQSKTIVGWEQVAEMWLKTAC
jgi:glycosyltransferase involved in cell wall biosynthesis